METKRTLSFRILLVVVAVCLGLLLIGCASTGKGKEDGAESERQAAEQEAVVQETSGSSAQADQQTVASAGGSKDNPQGRTAGAAAEDGRFQQYTASVKQALDRILPQKLTAWNWRRISTVLVGVLMMSMIYGTAFALGRLPLRKGRAGS
jgi:hypothetical protein